MAKDYYEILGVTKTATADEIKSAYRKLARKYHPDVNKDAGAQKKFTEVQHAYDILSEDSKRKLYDQFGSAAFEAGGPGTAAGQQQPGRARPGQQGGHYGWSNVGGPRSDDSGFGVDFTSDDAGSVFEAIFGGAEGNRRGSPFGGNKGRARGRAAYAEPEPEEVRQDITVDFLLAARGGTQRVRVSEGGKAKTIDVTIAPGTEEGAQLRIRGAAGGRDLILRIRLGAHDVFRRGEGVDAGKGLDLSLDLPLTIAEATLGGVVPVPTLTGMVELHVPPGAASGKKLRLRARGIHDAQGRQGDLYANIKIIPPSADALSEEQRKALEAIAATSPSVRTGPTWEGKG